jgi:sigma-B regulation protein RsbU (phosphoserine phosphatase)
MRDTLEAKTKDNKEARRQKPAIDMVLEICPILQLEHVPLEAMCIFKPIVEDLPVGVAIVNAQGTFTVFNREAKRILGMGPEQVGSAAWPEVYGCYLPDRVTLFPPERLPLARAIRGEEVTNELIFIRNACHARGVWIRVNSRPLPNVGGEQGWAVAVFTDVTEQRKAVEDIVLLSRAVEQTADSVLITDQAGRIAYVNSGFELTTGYTSAEAVGKTPRILKSGLHDADFYTKLWKTILAGKPYRGTLRNRKKNGELYWAEQTITPIINDAGKMTHFVSVLKDITESRKQQEQQIHMQLAREVQQRFYSRTASVPGLDVGAAVHPAEQTGGDYIDFVTAPDGSLGVAIGDVSGHGFGAALLMALTRAYVRSFCAEGLGVAKVLSAVNRMLLADLEGGQYVTMLLVHIDLADRVLSYASAGHVPGFILSRSGEVQTIMESTGIPLGLLTGHRIGAKLAPLQPGQVIILVTDGITEAGEPEEFGAERVIAYVREHRAEPAQQIADGVYRAARAHADGQAQQDDIAVVILKPE